MNPLTAWTTPRFKSATSREAWPLSQQTSVRTCDSNECEIWLAEKPPRSRSAVKLIVDHPQCRFVGFLLSNSYLPVSFAATACCGGENVSRRDQTTNSSDSQAYNPIYCTCPFGALILRWHFMLRARKEVTGLCFFSKENVAFFSCTATQIPALLQSFSPFDLPVIPQKVKVCRSSHRTTDNCRAVGFLIPR